MWQVSTSRPFWIRLMVGLVIGGIIAVGLPEAYRWLRGRETRPTETGRPMFHVALEQIFPVTRLLTSGQETPCVIIQASISNTGSPSAIGGLGLSANLAPGLLAVIGVAHTLPDEVRMELPDGRVEVFYAVDALNVVAESRPIETGQRVRGIMLYAFPDTPLTDLSAATTTYELAVTDLWGTRYTASSKGMAKTTTDQLLEAPQLHTRIIGGKRDYRKR